jgi:hypothetical protein
MGETRDYDGILSEVDPDRRTFIKRVAAVTAFAAPMIASYDLEALSPSVGHAAAVNGTIST